MQSSDVIYEFEIYELFVHQNLFPVTLTINFDYVLSSSEFYRTDSYSVTQNFDWDPLLIGIIIASVIGAIVVITAVAIIFVLLRRRKKRRIENGTPYKPISPA
jgi:heme/copper-type cytochrome/quinol oxidase subunit 2